MLMASTSITSIGIIENFSLSGSIAENRKLTDIALCSLCLIRRYNFPNDWFVGGEGGGMGLSMNGINQNGAFGNISLYFQGVQFGYNFQNAGGLSLTVYAGFDTLKYNAGIGGPFCPLRHHVRHTARL
jgi:hypothetical protein